MAEPLPRGIALLEGGKILVDQGPVRMTVAAWGNHRPLTAAALAGGRRAVAALGSLSRWLTTARLPMADPNCRVSQDQPQELKRMISFVKELGETDFTPLAAVAGTFSDLALEAACLAGADRVLVNNGGDIALAYGSEGKAFRLGLISDLETRSLSRVLELGPGTGIRGVATSGLGGRSLTKGVASAVTCLASCSGLADAAATAVANATLVDDPAVELCPAEALDPLTDLKGQLVVKRVGRLAPDKAREALERGLERAGELMDQGMVIGCLVFVQGRLGFLPPELEPIRTPSGSAIIKGRQVNYPSQIEA